MRQVLRRDARARVGHGDADAIAGRLRAQRDASRHPACGGWRSPPRSAAPAPADRHRPRSAACPPPTVVVSVILRSISVGRWRSATRRNRSSASTASRSSVSPPPFEARQVEQVADDRFELVRFLVGDVQILRARSVVELQLAHARAFRRSRGSRTAASSARARRRPATGAARGRTRRAPRRAPRRSAAIVLNVADERADFVAAGLVGAHVGAPLAERPRRVLETAQPPVGRPEDHAAPSSPRRRRAARCRPKPASAPPRAARPTAAADRPAPRRCRCARPFTDDVGVLRANGRRRPPSGRPPRPGPAPSNRLGRAARRRVPITGASRQATARSPRFGGIASAVRQRARSPAQHDDERLVAEPYWSRRCRSTSNAALCDEPRREILRDELGELRRRAARAAPHPVHQPDREAGLHEQQHREQGDVAQRDAPVQAPVPDAFRHR